MVNAEITALERRTRLTSAGFTTGLMATFLIFSLVWKGCMLAPPPDEIGSGEFELGGIVDYGDGQMGSMDINNFQQAAPHPTAANKPAGQVAPTPAPTKTDEPLTQDGPSPVTESTKPTPEPEKPAPTPPQLPKVEQASYPTQPTGGGGGSNHGDASTGTGNAGVASAEKLDPNGLYSFTEDGAGGLQGRKAVYFKDPVYNVQEEGTVTFEFIIEPDGSVSNVVPIFSNKTGLNKAGKDAIYNWQFSPIPAGKAQERQKVRVKIHFKLRG